MGGADHARLAVGEEHRRAIGGQDGQPQPRTVGHHRIRLGPLAGPGDGHHLNPGGMDLVDRDQVLDAQMGHDPYPVLGDRARVVI